MAIMDLSEQQRQAVKEWLAEGASLSDVQKRLKSEFDLMLTYMDVRLLILDIGATVQDKPEPKPAEPAAESRVPPPEGEDPYDDVFDDEPGGGLPSGEDGAAGGKVSLTLDRLVVPGAMFSGDVTFSDGVKARWMIDQIGRFGLDPEKPGYRPSDADLQAFQLQLRSELQRHGYA
jgi:hypothetical protein